MTNPNNAVGTNGAFGGRTSVNAFNDIMNVLSRGIISGWACVPNSGMGLSLGGNDSVRDVAVAEDNAGNKTSINNISGSPISVTIPTAPASNSRIDSIVAYVDNPPTGSATATDNPGACGLIVVSGTAASSPVAPTESAIRTAITADGASGTTAYYVVLANVTVASGTTTITSNNITAGVNAMIGSQNIDFTTSITSDGWTKTELANGTTLFSKTYDLLGSIGGTGQGTAAATIYPPNEFSNPEEVDIIGETFMDATAEIYYRRLDHLTRGGGCRVYGVSISGTRTCNGNYTITLLKKV